MPPSPQPPTRAYAAAFLVSAALILLQISFTRIVSYVLFYHFVFFAISLSLLGLGAAGTFVAVGPRAKDLDHSIHAWLLLLLVLVPVCFVLMAQPVPFWSPHLLLEPKLIGADAIAYLLWCSLFMVLLNFCGGVVLALLFSEYSDTMGSLYARDLIGAGSGCLLCIVLMKYGSPPLAFVSSVILVIGAVLPFQRALPAGHRRRSLGGLGMALAGALSVSIFVGPEPMRNFERFRSEGARATLKKYEWNHLIRTEHLGGENPSYVLDGAASTPIVRWSEMERSQRMTDPAYVIGTSEPRVAIIGFGGGPQVAEARRARAAKIMAIDINPTIATWVTNDDRGLNEGLFLDPSIELVVGEGRHTIRSSGRTFDVLVMHAIDTYAATSAGAYALSENFLYTKEALSDYLSSLSPEGIISIQRWLFNPPRENLRLFITALDALAAMGVKEPEKHVAMIAPVADFEALKTKQTRVWGYLLVTKSPIDEERLSKLTAHVTAMNWTTLYAPGLRTDTPFDAYVRSTDRMGYVAAYPYLISTVTDKSPYLFQFYNPLHKSAYQRNSDWAVSDLYQSSSVLLLVSLGVSVVLSLLIILLPLAWKTRGSTGIPTQAPFSLRNAVYFACLGMGFMALEVPLTQILSLVLGHPTFGFSVVLVALLLSTGLGSLLSERMHVRPVWMCTIVASILAGLTLGIFPIAEHTIHWGDFARFTLSILLIAACGVPIGFPLALGVRDLGGASKRNVAWAWAINGSSSVIGSCVIMIVMVFLGTQHALALGILCYAMAALAAPRTAHAARTRTERDVREARLLPGDRIAGSDLNAG